MIEVGMYIKNKKGKIEKVKAIRYERIDPLYITNSGLYYEGEVIKKLEDEMD